MALLTLFYLTTNIATAFVHLSWNDLVRKAIMLVKICLTNPAVPIPQGLLQLHCLVLLCFAVAISFKVTSATDVQTPLAGRSQTLDFDDIPTKRGWADLPDSYNNLSFKGFYVFKPSDPSLKGLISEEDLNCAISSPNALYGTRYNFGSALSRKELLEQLDVPTISFNTMASNSGQTPPSFTLRELKIKPLNTPIEYTKLNLRGLRRNLSDIDWSVDFPAGFHDPLHVDIAEFSQITWDGLEAIQIWADFHNSEQVMDWEFCLDDLKVSFASD